MSGNVDALGVPPEDSGDPAGSPAFDPATATAESVIRDGRLLSLIDALKAAGADLTAIKQAVTDKSMSALTQAIDEALLMLRQKPQRTAGAAIELDPHSIAPPSTIDDGHLSIVRSALGFFVKRWVLSPTLWIGSVWLAYGYQERLDIDVPRQILRAALTKRIAQDEINAGWYNAITICSDGSASRSTGQGTCSWHGGVNNSYYAQKSRAFDDANIDLIREKERLVSNAFSRLKSAGFLLFLASPIIDILSKLLLGKAKQVIRVAGDH